MLAVAITQPIYTSLSDVLGRKLPLYLSMLLFFVGCIIFAVAQSMPVVIAGRVIQGLGGGGLDVLEGIIISDITSLKERSLYLGLMGIPIATGAIIGPILGGLFAEYVSWRWIGWINLPFIGIAFLLAIFFLHLRPVELDFKSRVRQVDWTGMCLFAAGATCFTLPLSWADSLYPWSSWKTILPFVIGFLLLVVFGLYESKTAVPMFPYRRLYNRTALVCFIGSTLHGAIMYTALLYFPLFFQSIFLQEPLQSAVSILPLCCVTVGFSVISPISVQMTRRYRIQLCLGWALTAVFMGLWCLIDRNSSLATIATFQVMLGIGVGTIFTTTTIPLQASVQDANDAGTAAGMIIVVRLFGALLGLAAGSTAFNSVFETNIAGLGQMPESLRALQDPTQGVSFIPSLRSLDLPRDSMDSLIEVYRTSFRGIWIILTCISGCGFIATLFLEHLGLEKEEQGRQQFEPSKAQ